MRGLLIITYLLVIATLLYTIIYFSKNIKRRFRILINSKKLNKVLKKNIKKEGK